MPNKNWNQLSSLQIGRYAEYYVKMEFASYGFEVYTSEVDDHGVDFIAKKGESQYFDIQVKSVRGLNYIFLQKNKFILRWNLYAAIVIFVESEMPHLFLIPSNDWEQPNNLLVSRDYEGLKSSPEWGLNLSHKNNELLNQYLFEKTIINL
jgi:hypothetical protein